MGTRREVAGKDMVFKFDPAGGTNYYLIVCQLDGSITSTTAVIDTASKCGPGKLPGQLDNKANLQIVDVLDTDNGEISSDILFTLQQAKTIFTWTFGPLVPAAGDLTYSGSAFLSNWNLTAPLTDAVKTTCDLEITGTVTQTRTGS